MVIVALLFIGIVCFFVLKHYVVLGYHWARFSLVRNKFVKTWNRLSIFEKIEILYAWNGLLFEQNEKKAFSITHQYSIDKNIREMSVRSDSNHDEWIALVYITEDYEKLEEFKLTGLFTHTLDECWKSIRCNGKFDKNLDYNFQQLFDRRVELSTSAKNKKGYKNCFKPMDKIKIAK